MTYKENSNVFLNNTRRYLTSWANEIYVATGENGVYYTDNFLDPLIQPVWTAINSGLAGTNCQQLQLDPFNQAGRQYVLINLGDNDVLYTRYNGGNWVEIFNSITASVWAGAETRIAGFCIDEHVPGRLWVSLSISWAGGVVHSDDYGNTWIYKRVWSGYNYGVGCIRAYGDSVYFTASIGAGGAGVCWYSATRGSGWNYTVIDPWNSTASNMLNPLSPHKTYTGGAYAYGMDLFQVYDTGGHTKLQDSLVSFRSDTLWFNPIDENHQRAVRSGRLYTTTDSWLTVDTAVDTNPNPYSIAPWASNDTDKMFLGTNTWGGGNHHKIGALLGERNTNIIGIAGTNCNIPPYIDSIPDLYGGLAIDGIQAVKLSTSDNNYGMRVFECED